MSDGGEDKFVDGPLEPGDLTADELVRMHDDLSPGPSDAGYRARWDDWQQFVRDLDEPDRAERVGRYIEDRFEAPADAGLQSGAAGVAGAGAAHALSGVGGGGAAGAATAQGHVPPVPAHGAATAADAASLQAAGRATPAVEARAETPAEHKNGGRTARRVGAVALAVLVIGGSVVLGKHIADSRKSNTSSSAITLTAQPLSTVQGASCAIRETVRYHVKDASLHLAGQTATIDGIGSVEKTVHAPVRADGTFDVTFNTPPQGSGGACRSTLTLQPRSIGSVSAVVSG
jgi:hypothetical protein